MTSKSAVLDAKESEQLLTPTDLPAKAQRRWPMNYVPFWQTFSPFI